jgi:hypothetical protein
MLNCLAQSDEDFWQSGYKWDSERLPPKDRLVRRESDWPTNILFS